MPNLGLGIGVEKNNAFGHEPSPSYVTDGLVAYWDAGNPASYPGSGTDWLDLTINNNHGVLTNGATYSTVGGAHIAFDGDNDYVELGSIDSLNPLSLFNIRNLSVELWINPTAGGDPLQRVIEKSNVGGDCANGWGLFIGSGNLYFCINLQSINTSTLGIGTIFSYSTWQQLVVTRNSTNQCQFYLNGNTFGGTIVFKRAIPSDTTNARIATWNHSTGREYKGQIGAIRVYSKTLSTSEVQTNYNQLKGRYGLS